MIDLYEGLERMLVREEGEVLHAYPDHLGYLTIGVGILIDKRKGGGITREESRYLLRNRVRTLVEYAESTYPWFSRLDPARQAVVIGMMFQLGASGFYAFRATRAAIERGDYEQAATQMLSSLWAKQTPARAHRMAHIMRTGEWTY